MHSRQKFTAVILSIVLTAAVALSVAFGLGCDLSPFLQSDSSEDTFSSASQQYDESFLSVHFIDVGQGDAIFIASHDKRMLIDAGTNASGAMLVEYLEDQGVEYLDYVIGTHPHADHIGGMDDIINAFEIGTVIMPEAAANTRTFEEVLDAIERKDLRITKPSVGNRYDLSEDAAFTVIAPGGSDEANLNNHSVGVRLTCGDKAFIFCGDAEKQSERQIISLGRTLSADVLKVSHHGSNTSSTQEFLDAVNPAAAVICVGAGNTYGHPSDEVLDRLKAMGVQIYRTDRHGTIIFETDGGQLTVKTEK